MSSGPDTTIIVSQVSHLMTAFALMTQFGRDEPYRLLIVNRFHGARSIHEKMQATPGPFPGLRVALFRTDREAHRAATRAGTRVLFTEGDVSARKGLELLLLKLRSPATAINVYEEGIAPYRDDLYHGWKKRLFPRIGIATHFGGFALTKSLYLYTPGKHTIDIPRIKRKIRRIDMTPLQTFETYRDYLSHVFGYQAPATPTAPAANVYLSGHHVSEEFLRTFSRTDGDNYIKLHPRAATIDPRGGVRILNQTVPAEILLADLAKQYEKVVVYHHGSSAATYLSAQNISFHIVK